MSKDNARYWAQGFQHGYTAMRNVRAAQQGGQAIDSGVCSAGWNAWFVAGYTAGYAMAKKGAK